MASVNDVIFRLEGYINAALTNPGGSGLTPATNAGLNTNYVQAVSTWLEQVKATMRQPGLRDLTDWEMYATGNVPNTSATNNVRTGASTLYAVLWGSIDTAKAVWEVVYNGTGKTFSAIAAVDATAVQMNFQPATASASFREYMGHVDPFGIACATAIQLAADGTDGTDVTANDISAVVVYRTA